MLTNFYDCKFFPDREDDSLSGSVSIKIERDKSTFEGFKYEFEIVEPFVDYVVENDNKEYKSFRIFDYELSEYETRHLLYHDDSDCKVVGKFDREYKVGTLEDCYNFIKERFYLL